MTVSVATLADLDPAAIDILRARWIEHSGNQALANRSTPQLFEDADLVTQNGVPYAALIMAGTHTPGRRQRIAAHEES